MEERNAADRVQHTGQVQGQEAEAELPDPEWYSGERVQEFNAKLPDPREYP